MKRGVLAVVVTLLLGTAPGAHAQVWDTPSFMGPRPGSDLGFYLVDVGEIGFQGIWRTSRATNLGFRLGYVDAADGIVTVGVETWGDIVVQDADFPLDLSWTIGGGAWLNGITAISVPLGISFGRTFDLGTLPVQAYGHPRISLVAAEDPVTDDLELELEGQFDIGADLFLGEDWKLRVGLSFGGNDDALGIGLAWRL